jgi:hypothetical protein
MSVFSQRLRDDPSLILRREDDGDVP